MVLLKSGCLSGFLSFRGFEKLFSQTLVTILGEQLLGSPRIVSLFWIQLFASKKIEKKKLNYSTQDSLTRQNRIVNTEFQALSMYWIRQQMTLQFMALRAGGKPRPDANFENQKNKNTREVAVNVLDFACTRSQAGACPRPGLSIKADILASISIDWRCPLHPDI